MCSRTSVRLAAVLLLAAGCSGGPSDHEPSPAASDATAEGAATVATLVERRGDVRVEPAGTGQWVAATVGRGLAASDAVQTMESATAVVRFEGTDVTTSLTPNTTLRIPEQSPRVARLRHLSGQLTARLSPRPDTERLEVALPTGDLVLDRSGRDADGVAEARVTIEDDVSEIAMVHGRGRLLRHGGSSIAIEEAHYLQVHTETGVVDGGVDVSPPGDGAPVDGAELVTSGRVRFRWAVVAGAERYLLVVQTASGAIERHEVDGAGAALTLPAGQHAWSVRALLGGEPGRPTALASFSHRIDRTPPPLTIERPRANEVVSRAVRIVGHTEPGASVRVNGEPVAVSSTGAFRASIPVSVGLSNLVVEARDPLGNRRAATRSVLRSP